MTPATHWQTADALDRALTLLGEFLPPDHAELNRLGEALGRAMVQICKEDNDA